MTAIPAFPSAVTRCQRSGRYGTHDRSLLQNSVSAEDADDETAALLITDTDQYDTPSLLAHPVANNPGVLAALQRCHEAVVDAADVNRRLAELVYLAVSVTNDCEYCVASPRAALGEQVGVDEPTVDALVCGDFDPFVERERAAVEFAKRVTADPPAISESSLASMPEARFDDATVVKRMTAATAAVSANTIPDALDIPPND